MCLQTLVGLEDNWHRGADSQLCVLLAGGAWLQEASIESCDLEGAPPSLASHFALSWRP